jgi:hypothetical protein
LDESGFRDTEEIGMPAATISAVQALTDFVAVTYGVPPVQTRILVSTFLPTRYPPVWMLVQSEPNRFLNDMAFVSRQLRAVDIADTVHYRTERPRIHNRAVNIVLTNRESEPRLFIVRFWQLPGPRIGRTSYYPLLAEECVRMRLTVDPSRFPEDMMRNQLHEHVCRALSAAAGDRGGIVPARPDEDLARRIQLLPQFDPLLTNRTSLVTNLCLIPANHAALCGRTEITDADRQAQAHVLQSCVPMWVEKVLREYLRLGDNRLRADDVVKTTGLEDGTPKRRSGRSIGRQIIHNLWTNQVLEDRLMDRRPAYRIRFELVSDIEHILAGSRGAVSHSGSLF